MFRKFLVLTAVAITGCAQLPVEMATVTGQGRFFLMKLDGAILAQFDVDSAQRCKDESATVEKKPNLAFECSSISYDAYLPYSFSTVNVLSEARVVLRFKTQEGCDLLNGIERKKDTPGIRVSECKKSTTYSNEVTQ